MSRPSRTRPSNSSVEAAASWCGNAVSLHQRERVLKQVGAAGLPACLRGRDGAARRTSLRPGCEELTARVEEDLLLSRLQDRMDTGRLRTLGTTWAAVR